MKQFKVKMWVGASPTKVTVTAQNSANALAVVRKLYPTAKVINAKQD
jgi:hypothetical protein